MTVIGDVSGKTCIIVDDICDTAGTLCKAAEVLMEAGATEVHSYITHGVLVRPGGGADYQIGDEIADHNRFHRADRCR